MPVPQIRNGNAWIETLQFTKAHGSAPSQCEVTTPYIVSMVRGTIVDFLVDSSRWTGSVMDVQGAISSEGGRTSIIRAVDFRDHLFDDVIFARFNMIDQHTGEVYSEINDDDIHIEGKYFAFEIINLLCAKVGFSTAYSTNAAAIIQSDTNANWRNSRYNIYNIDWSSGVKIGAALDHMCELLGLQLTILFDGTRHLRFTVKGIGDIEDMATNLTTFIVSGREGDAVQADVDSGLWITGERNQYEFQGVALLPAWNLAWSKYANNRIKLVNDLKKAAATNGELTGNMLVDLVEDFLPDDGFIDGQKFNKMTILDYINTVPGYVFRISGIEQLLRDVEFNGTVPVREAKISAGLISEPNKDYRVYTHGLNNESKNVQLPVDSADEYSELNDGYKVLPSTGHVVFSEPRFVISAAAKEAKKVVLAEDDLIPDTPFMDVVALGTFYRSFWGTSERIGSKQVSGLRQNFIIPDPGEGANSIQADVGVDFEYLLDGEKLASEVAEDVATAILSRPRIIRSGEAEIRGSAGWSPTGDVSRVTVTVNASDGIVERIDYGNDENRPEYEPQLEIRRKLAVDRESKLIEQSRKYLERARLKYVIRSVDNSISIQKNKKDGLVDAALEALNRANYVRVENPAGEFHESGDPVVATPDATQQFSSIDTPSVNDKDKRVIGINLVASDGKLAVATAGMAMANVTGPVDHGDTLALDKASWTLKKDDSGTILAMQDIADSSSQLIPVRMGGGGGGGKSNSATARAASTANIATLSGPVTVDGVSLIADDVILLKDQTDRTQNDLYTIKAGAWERTGELASGLIVSVREGNQSASIWICVANGTLNIGTTLIDFYSPDNTADVATTAASGLTGTANIDGQTIAGRKVLVKNQSGGSASQNGLYFVPSAGGAWLKISQPDEVGIRLGAVSGRTRYIKTAANVYQGGLDFWG